MKQETIEEVAERLYPMVGNEYLWHIPIQRREGFIAGAKWQQERRYSVEEVNNIIESFIENLEIYNPTFKVPRKEWFEQFKKK